MKYMLMFVQTDEDAAEKSLGPETMQTIGRWFDEHAQAGRFVGGYQLSPRRTATTVKWNAGKPLVSDGPFIETKEAIGGYGIFEVSDLDAAIVIAKTWPAPQHHIIEIRPIRENPMRDPRLSG